MSKKRLPKPLLAEVLKMRSQHLDAQLEAKHRHAKLNPCIEIPPALMPVVEEMITNYYSTLERSK